MTNTLKSALLATFLLPTAAMANIAVGTTLGKTEADVRANLTTLGYSVEAVETEDDEIEAEILKDGQRFEVEVASDTGLVTEFELENEDDND